MINSPKRTAGPIAIMASSEFPARARSTCSPNEVFWGGGRGEEPGRSVGASAIGVTADHVARLDSILAGRGLSSRQQRRPAVYRAVADKHSGAGAAVLSPCAVLRALSRQQR